MPSIADIRSSYPMYANMSDADLTAALQSRFGDDYVSMSPQNLAAAGKAIAGMAEVPVAAATGAVAVPLAGLAGAAALPEGAATATDVVDEVRQGLTYQPRTAAGQEYARTVGKAVQPLQDLARAPGRALQDAGYPVAGAIAQGLPEAAAAALPFARGVGRVAEAGAEGAAGAVRRFSPEYLARNAYAITRQELEARVGPWDSIDPATRDFLAAQVRRGRDISNLDTTHIGALTEILKRDPAGIL